METQDNGGPKILSDFGKIGAHNIKIYSHASIVMTALLVTILLTLTRHIL
jgi:hypothetical protein